MALLWGAGRGMSWSATELSSGMQNVVFMRCCLVVESRSTLSVFIPSYISLQHTRSTSVDLLVLAKVGRLAKALATLVAMEGKSSHVDLLMPLVVGTLVEALGTFCASVRLLTSLHTQVSLVT
ncbi:hypothetical protein NDU88_011162 [Pleurodeles waltl]|uniref:Secreted protein n=1 Tax=Pleurodeles waltl TaxID=8319 RepID=A0AAV7PWZ5_PLEWA|nr:hypothetical protein NDU88_011162 [Pleurodeles waltl]